MRPSKREQILDQAIELINASGIDALTYEALAQATDMSKSGLVYHFSSRRELVLSIHRYLAEQWEAELVSAAGGPATKLGLEGRLEALVTSLSHRATKADLLVQLEAADDPEARRIWHEVEQRWLPDPREIQQNPRAYLVLVAAEGLWLHDFVHVKALSPAERRALVTGIRGLIADAA